MVVAEVLPDVFLRVEFGAVGRQKQGRDVVREDERTALPMHPAPSIRITAWASSSTRRLISSRCRFMAGMFASGMTMAMPVSRAGQTAPKMSAQSSLWSRGMGGLDPRRAQTRVSVPFCPTRASSWNQSSMRLPRALSGRTSATFAAKFF